MAGEYSSVPGFRLCDFDTACPAGGPCPAQEKFVSDYVGNAGHPDIDLEVSLKDRALLGALLTGYHATAKTVGCEGSEGGQCIALMTMKESPVQRTAVGAIKRILIGKK